MTSYIIRRLLVAIPVLFGISVLIFVFVALAPGDPVSAYMNPELGSNPALRDQLIRQLGLDQPLPIRYLHWLAQTLQGNLGYGIVSGLPVNSMVWSALQASVALVGTALIMGNLIGIPLGVISALRQYTALDFGLTTVAFFGISTPSFLLGLGGLFIFGLQLGWFPIGGMTTPGSNFHIGDFLGHLALPATVLGVSYIAIMMRYTRSAMLDVIGSLYITTAEAKGLPPRIVIARHAFRNALIPIFTIIGLTLPDMFGAAVITETVFSWPGMGSLMVTAVSGRDFPVIMGIAIVIAVGVAFVNLVTDVAYAAVDPRIRY